MRGWVALFAHCAADTLWPETGVAMVRPLGRSGVAVDFPSTQTSGGPMRVA